MVTIDGPATERLPCSRWRSTSITCPKQRRSSANLTQRERDVLALLREGLASREIAERLALSEATVYLVIADLLDAIEYKPPAASADEIHRRAGTRPASQTEVTRFHQQFGPFTPTAKAEPWMPAGPGRRARVRFDRTRSPTSSPATARPARPRCDTPAIGSSAKACHWIGCAPAGTNTAPATSLPDCLKVYLPDRDGDRRMIFQHRDRRGRASAQLTRPRGSVISRAAHELPTPTRSPTIAFTADGPGDGCRDATDAVPNDPRCDAQRPGRRSETRRLDSWDRPPERHFRSRAGAPKHNVATTPPRPPQKPRVPSPRCSLSCGRGSVRSRFPPYSQRGASRNCAWPT
jgi:regulatory LuxR family protein